MLFDAVLDCTGEAARCVSLLRRGGAMCSIQAGPTAECITTWMQEAKLDPSTITFGVRGFLTSSIGGSLVTFFSGGSALVSACHRRGAQFSHVIGTGNGEIMGEIAALLESSKIR